MTSYADEEFLQIAIEKNFITQKQSQDAINLQKQMIEKKSIGQILLDNKWIQESQYNVVKTFLQYQTRRLPALKPMEKKGGAETELDLALKASKEGLISKEKLIECILKQKEIQAQGKEASLLQIITEKGYIQPSDIEYLKKGAGQYSAQSLTGRYPVQQEKVVPEPPVNLASFHFLAPILIVLSEPYKNKVFPLSKKENFIGRVRAANICIEHSTISRIHCKIQYLDMQGWEIVDMMSNYGILVNGKKVKKHFLCNRDQIQLGDVLLEIRGI